jgi:hypothetical protein
LREENGMGTVLRHDRIMRKRAIERVNRGNVEAMK